MWVIQFLFYFSHEEQHERMQADYQKLQIEHFEIREQFDDLTEKMKFFTKV